MLGWLDEDQKLDFSPHTILRLSNSILLFSQHRTNKSSKYSEACCANPCFGRFGLVVATYVSQGLEPIRWNRELNSNIVFFIWPRQEQWRH